jgi:putative (di)nucleoside polyphosphate hydrolase
MKEKYKKLPLRSGVGIVILNKENKIFVAKRIDNPKNFWQLPQGGVDENENFYTAALRELKEETSIVSVKLIKEIEDKLTYILPDHLIGIIWKGKFKGQKQKWFIMKFIGNNNEINIKTKNPEFLDWKWINISNLPNVAVNFKIHIYKKLKEELNYMNLN